MNLLSFHKIASARGDGLHPNLTEFLVAHAAKLAEPKVRNLAQFRGDGNVQAGPYPIAPVNTPPPTGVLLFPSAEAFCDSLKAAAS